MSRAVMCELVASFETSDIHWLCTLQT